MSLLDVLFGQPTNEYRVQFYQSGYYYTIEVSATSEKEAKNKVIGMYRDIIVTDVEEL